MLRRIFFVGAMLAVLLAAGPVPAQLDQTPINTPKLPPESPPKSPANFDSTHVLVQQAGHWANFQNDINHWGSRNVTSANELELALLDFARYDGAMMAPGWMATNALIAIQTKEFVAGIRQWETWYGRELLLQNLHRNPAYALFFPGSNAAQEAVLHAADRDARRLKLIGNLFKQQAYSMQKQSWANKKHTGKTSRLAAIQIAPATPKELRFETLAALAAPGMNQLSEPYDPQTVKINFLSALRFGPRSAWAQTNDGLPVPSIAAHRELTIVHTLGLAALLVLDEDQNHPNFTAWMTDTQLDECVDWSRVHLNQCVAAGHFVFESSFCIAEHQLMDAGRCIADLAAPSRPPTQLVH